MVNFTQMIILLEHISIEHFIMKVLLNKNLKRIILKSP